VFDLIKTSVRAAYFHYIIEIPHTHSHKYKQHAAGENFDQAANLLYASVTNRNYPDRNQ